MVRLFSRRHATKQQSGVVLVAALIMTGALVTVGLAMASSVATRNRLVVGAVYGNNALLTAEAGVEQSVEGLNASETFAGYSTPQTFFNNATQGKGTFTTTISANPDGTNAKIIVSTGTVYRPGTNTAIQKRTVKVTVVGTSSPGYSVYTGPGGLNMSGVASINNSDLFVNGTITMSGVSRIGSDLQPSNVYVANDACPTGATPGPTYPTVCSGTQPISIGNNNLSSIIGTVCATGQTQAAFPANNPIPQIRAGLAGGAGLELGCTTPPGTPPTYDRAAQIAAVTTTASGNSSTYNCQGLNQAKTWPANLELTGNVTINGICGITVKGNVYITGDLTINAASRFIADNSVGATRPVVIVDGTITVGGAATMISNSQGTGIEFISFKSSNGCTTTPAGCTLTGNDLKTSQGIQTVSVGGGVSFPGMVFDAYWGKISLSGSGNVGAAIGQTVDLSGAGSIIFGTTLSSGVKTWSVTSYQQIANP